MSKQPVATAANGFSATGGARPARRSSRGWPRRLFHLAVLAVLAYLAYLFIDFRLLGRTLATTPWPAMAAMLALSTADRWLMAIKWRQLCRIFEPGVPLLRYVRIYYASSFINYTIPSMFGGDLYRAVALVGDIPDRKGHVYASILMEKVVAFTGTILCAWAGLAWLLPRYPADAPRIALGLVAAVSAAAIAALVASLHPGVYPRATSLLNAMRLRKIARGLESVFRAYLEFAQHRGVLFRNLLLAVFENGVQVSLAFVAAWALGVDVSAADLAAIIFVAQLVRRIAMYIEGKGLAEGLNVAMYGLVGIEPSVALAISLLGHASNILASLPGALLVFLSPRRERLIHDGER